MFPSIQSTKAVRFARVITTPFRIARAAGGEDDVKRIFTFDAPQCAGRCRRWLDVSVSKTRAGVSVSAAPAFAVMRLDALARERAVDRHVGPAGLHRCEKGDEHFGLFVADDRDGLTRVAQLLFNPLREGIGAGGQVPIGHLPVTADVRGPVRSFASPAADAVEQVHGQKPW